MARRPCRSCGELLYVGRASLPEPMCQPCRRGAPRHRKARVKVQVRCVDCNVDLVYGLTETPRCRPCRVRARYPRMTDDQRRARQRRRNAAARLERAARGSVGRGIWTQGNCNWCGESFMAKGSGPARWCSPRCDRRAKSQRRTTVEFGGTGWRWSDFMRIARTFDYCCAYCGTKPERLDPDHVVPLARGGDDSLSNLLPVCLQCNSDKRDLLLDEWREDRAIRRLPPRNTSADHPHLALPQPTGRSWSMAVA